MSQLFLYQDSIFSGCTNLTSITIPNSVTSIGDWAFSDCTSLTSVTIPNSVTSIGRYAFDGCYNVISMVVESGNIKYDSRDNCNAIIETESNTLISGCKTTIIPNNVTSIGEDAFSGCASLISITIPNSITNIGEDAFIGCTGLTSITIPNSVVYIGEWAFNGCTGLTSITIPNSVTSIDRGAFEDCTNLTTVTIGNNDHLNIWWIVFDGCESLESVTCYAETPPTITFFETTDEEGNPFKEGAFYADRLSEMKLYVPAKAIEQYKKAEEWKDFGQIIPIGATTIETDDDKPIVQPSLADVTITWKIVPNTDTYTILPSHVVRRRYAHWYLMPMVC